MRLFIFILGDPDGVDWSTHMIASATAGATGASITNPLWVVKTRFMVRCSDLGHLNKLLIYIFRLKIKQRYLIDIHYMLYKVYIEQKE